MASTSIVENYPDPIRSEFADDLELVKLAETVSNEENMSGKIKYDLREKINALTAVDHINLFKIVYNHNYKKVHTTTNRGTFFDLNDLDNKTLWKVEKFISLILNKMEQDKVAEKIEHEKKITELANKNRLKENLKNERKVDDSLIPRGNHSKHQQKSGNNFYDEILAASSTTSSTNSTAVSTAATSNQSSTAKVTNTPSVTADNKAKEAKVAFPMSNALSMFMNRSSDSTTSSVPANTTAKTLGKVVTLGKVSNNTTVPTNLNVSTLGKFQKVDARNDFVGGSVCITDEDLDGPNGLTNGEEGDEDDENDEDGLEDDDEDYDGEEGEYDLDPNQMIKNGGRSYVDDE